MKFSNSVGWKKQDSHDWLVDSKLGIFYPWAAINHLTNEEISDIMHFSEHSSEEEGT